MKIGSLKIDGRYIAAPLAGTSNPVYRRLCRKHGAAYTVSEMISDKALHYNNARTKEMCAVFEDERPTSLQLFGSEPETMAEAARYLTEYTACDMIDINMGCPVPKVVKNNGGSALMKDPDLAAAIVQAVKASTDRPVTVKIRAGWDERHITCASFAALMEQAGADAIAVHGRTRSQMYSGCSRNEYIRQVKQAVSVPVIGNGDILTVSDADRMFAETGADAVMIGRGLLGRPWFLQQLNLHDQGIEMPDPGWSERLDGLLDYADRLGAYMGEHTAVAMMRGMSGWYVTAMPYSASLRQKLASADSLSQMRDLVEEYRAFLRASNEE